MASSNRWVSFVTKLNRQTQEGRIQWNFVGGQEDLTDADFERYGSIYVAAIDDTNVRIYTLKTLRGEQSYWDEEIILDIQTSDFADFVRIPIDSTYLKDLYESVKYTSNKIGEFLERFLKEE